MDLSSFEDAVTLYDIRCPFAGRKGIESGFWTASEVRSTRSQNIHFTFSGAVGWKDTANMPGTGSMDGSQSRWWTRTARERADTTKRKRTRSGQIGRGKGRIGRTQGWGSIVNSRVGSSWRCILHPRVYKLQGRRVKGGQRGREDRRIGGQIAGESRV